MSAIALLNEAQKPLEPGRKRKKARLSKRVLEAIELLATGECATQKAAAARVGITPEWLCKQLRSEQGRAVLREYATDTLAVFQPRAALRVAEMMSCGSSKVELAAAQHVLAVCGIAPARGGGITINNNNVVQAGYVIKLKGRAEPVEPDGEGRMRDITPARSE